MFIQWLKGKMRCRANKKHHDIIKLQWKKAELQYLLEHKEEMTPEEFGTAYRNIMM